MPNNLNSMPWDRFVPQRNQDNQNQNLGDSARKEAEEKISEKQKIGINYTDLIKFDGPKKPDIDRQEARKRFETSGDPAAVLKWLEYDRQVVVNRAEKVLSRSVTDEQIQEAIEALQESGVSLESWNNSVAESSRDEGKENIIQEHTSHNGFDRRKFLKVIIAGGLGLAGNQILGKIKVTKLGKKVEQEIQKATEVQAQEIQEEEISQRNLNSAWAVTSAFFAIILTGITRPEALPIGKETATGMITSFLARNAYLRSGNPEDKETAKEELTELLTNFAIAAGLAELADLSNYVKIYVAKLIREYQPITETLEAIDRDNIYTLLEKPNSENLDRHKLRESAIQENLTKLMGQIAGTAFVSSAVATTYLGASVVKSNLNEVFRLKYHHLLQSKILALYEKNPNLNDEEYTQKLQALEAKSQLEATKFMNSINGFVNIFSKTAGNLVPFGAGDPPLFFHYLEFKDELGYLSETFGDGVIRGLILSQTNYLTFLTINGMQDQIPGFIQANLESIKNLSLQVQEGMQDSTFLDLAVFEGDQTAQAILNIIKDEPNISNEKIVKLLNEQNTSIGIQVTVKEKLTAQINYIRQVWSKMQKSEKLLKQTQDSLSGLAQTNLEELDSSSQDLIKYLSESTPTELQSIFDIKNGEIFSQLGSSILQLRQGGKIPDELVKKLTQARNLFTDSQLGKIVYDTLLKAERGQLQEDLEELLSLQEVLQILSQDTQIEKSLLQARPLLELSVRQEVLADPENTNLEPEEVQDAVNRKLAEKEVQNSTPDTQPQLAKALKQAVEKIGSGLSGSEGQAFEADTDSLLEHTGTEVWETLLTQIPSVDSLVKVVQHSILPQIFPPKKHEATESAIAEMNSKIEVLFTIGAVLSGFADNVAAYLFMRKSIMEVIAEYLDITPEETNKVYKSVAKNSLFNAICAGTMSTLGNGPTVETLQIDGSKINEQGDLVDITTKPVPLAQSIQSPITLTTLTLDGVVSAQRVLSSLANIPNLSKSLRPEILASKS